MTCPLIGARLCIAGGRIRIAIIRRYWSAWGAMSEMAFYEKVIKSRPTWRPTLLIAFHLHNPPVVRWVAVKGVPRGRSSRPLTGPHVSSSSSWERSETQFSGASFVSGFGFFVRSQKRADQRLVPIRFSRFCLRPPLLPGFYPHSQGATVGPVHVGVRSQNQAQSQS